MTGYIDLKRDSFLEKGIEPRQRRVFVLRWNPSVSGFTREDFENYFSQYKDVTKLDHDHPLDWTVWDWKEVMHRDLFVMVQVGQAVNGIVWGGFFGGRPYRYEMEDGSFTKAYFFETDVMYMHRIEKTGILTAERLQAAVPEVDWLHGHSGEILSVESAEKLGLFLVDELRKVEENDDMYFDSYNQKTYVMADILTFMCPELKKRLKEAGKLKNKRLRNINNMMVHIDDKRYMQWEHLEDHLSLERLDGILL